MVQGRDLTTGRLIFRTTADFTEGLVGDDRLEALAAEGFDGLAREMEVSTPKVGTGINQFREILQGVSVHPLAVSLEDAGERGRAVASLNSDRTWLADPGRKMEKNPLRYWVTEKEMREGEGDRLFSRLLDQIRVAPGILDLLYLEPTYRDPRKPGQNRWSGRDLYVQGYLEPGPTGVNARAAWSLGMSGDGISFGDVERTWCTNHEDLPSGIIHGPVHGDNQKLYSGDCQEHGTNVLGVVAASDNSVGVSGIASQIERIFLSSRLRKQNPSQVSTAIRALRDPKYLRPGDVLLVETETGSGHPVEVVPDVFHAIREAVDRGIIVIEPAGNGGHDLDSEPGGVFFLPPGLGWYSREHLKVTDPVHPGRMDSGAIMVGAASIPDDFPEALRSHHRRKDLNYGSRVGCYAWGNRVATTGLPRGFGDPVQADCIREYEEDFGGTSAAAAIIAGVAVLTQQMHKRAKGRVATPHEMRCLLTDPDLGTPSEEDSIGVMPDLGLIAKRLEL